MNYGTFERSLARKINTGSGNQGQQDETNNTNRKSAKFTACKYINTYVQLGFRATSRGLFDDR